MTGKVESLLVSVDLGKFNIQLFEQEFIQLAISAGALVTQLIRVRRSKLDAALLIGSGKVDEIAEIIQSTNIQLIIFNHQLTPVQQRNLEAAWNTRVIDRQSLILDIFAQRARSAYGKCQVELAQLEYISTRLVGAWTHLERQKGGIGLRGPGETQLETDRRLLAERVKHLKAKRKKIQTQQITQRRSRTRRPVFSISLVGYTNAGKSSLFNLLTKAKTYSADQLFATLDTTVRQLYLSGIGDVVLSDTVGFIQNLPHQLIDSFKATLDETLSADLLLHVVDASSLVFMDQIHEVNKVLKEIGANLVRQLLVFNKIDLVPDLLFRDSVDYDQNQNSHRVFVSAKTGDGIESLRTVLTQIVSTNFSDIRKMG